MFGSPQVSDDELNLRRALNRANSRPERQRVRRALNAARPHAPRWAPPQGLAYDGVLVRPAQLKTPWCRSAAPNRTSTFSHIPRWALIAWRRSRPQLMLVEFMCGRSSFHAVGELDPSGDECGFCLLASKQATICKVDQ